MREKIISKQNQFFNRVVEKIIENGGVVKTLFNSYEEEVPVYFHSRVYKIKVNEVFFEFCFRFHFIGRVKENVLSGKSNLQVIHDHFHKSVVYEQDTFTIEKVLKDISDIVYMVKENK